MRIEYLKEFLHFSKSLNITQAARDLFTTQSTLSKHIRQIEQEIGAQLVVYETKKMSLTPAGSLFASKARAIVNLYDEAVEQCLEASKRELVVVKAQYISYQDTASLAYLSFTQQLRSSDEASTVKYARTSHRDFKTALKRGSIDIALEYHCGDAAEIVAAYRGEGFRALHLASDALGVWASPRLLDATRIELDELRSIPFAMPSDTSAHVYNIMADIERLCGFTADVRIAGTDSQLEFIYSHDGKCAYLWPLSFLSSSLFDNIDDMRAFPVEGTENLVHGFAIALAFHPDEAVERILGRAFDE